MSENATPDDLFAELFNATEITPEQEAELRRMAERMCGRCYGDVDELFPANCAEKPEALLLGAPLGQYHCPNCDAMVVAGIPHPPMCKRCIDRAHPDLDRKETL